MAKKKAVRRENGRGTVEKTSNKKNPFRAKVSVGTKLDKNGKIQAVYKVLGSYPTREEAENALLSYSRAPYDLTDRVKTFSDLYEAWSERYFASLNSESSKRTVTSAYAYCSGLYDMPIRMIGPGHIRDAMETGYVIPTTGKDKGNKRYASLNTQERIKSMCNLMFDYAVERRIVLTNPARAFKVGDLLEEIKKKSKGKMFSKNELS